MLMKRVIFGISFTAIIPFAFICALIFALFSYRSYYNTKTEYLSRENKVAFAALPPSENSFSAKIESSDGRVEKIRQFLSQYNSPLEPYASDIVEAADEYDLDYRLIPAIAMQESNLCKKIPNESYNCWGYGIYGGKVHRFEDYKEGIYAVTKTLAIKYKNNGLVTPDEIMTRWTPSSKGSWAYSVNHFMDKLQ